MLRDSSRFHVRDMGDNCVHYSKFLAFHGGFSDHTWVQVESHDLMWDGESLGAKIKGHLDAPAL